jgi:hypothetical protein
MVRRWLIAAAVAVAVGGCGGGSGDAAKPRPTATPAVERAAATSAPELVFFQRQGAAGATLDTFTVRRDGTARLEKRYGGAGGRFKDLELRRGALRRLRAALARLRGAGTLERGTPDPGGATFLMRYRGRTLAGRQGAIAPRARGAVELLDGLIDGAGVRKPTRETATNNP